MSKQFYFKQFRLVSIEFQCQKQFYFKTFSLTLVRSLNIKRVLFQVIQFSISTQFRFIWPIDRTLSVAATPGLCGPWSDGNAQSSRITGALLSDCLASYLGHSFMGFTPFQRCSRSNLQPKPSGQSHSLIIRKLYCLWNFSATICTFQ